MKNKIKKIKLPLNKMTGNEKDYTAVLLEDVNSNMKAFWEVLSGVKEKGDATWDLLQEVKEKGDATWDLLQEVKEKGDATFEQTGLLTEKLTSVEFKFDSLAEEINFIKEEIKKLKITLSEKADKEKLKILEFKIIRIESHLKLA